MASFRGSGNARCFSDKLQIWDKGAKICQTDDCSNMRLISSCLGAEFFKSYFRHIHRSQKIIEFFCTFSFFIHFWNTVGKCPTNNSKKIHFSAILDLSEVKLPSFNLNFYQNLNLFVLIGYIFSFITIHDFLESPSYFANNLWWYIFSSFLRIFCNQPLYLLWLI